MTTEQLEQLKATLSPIFVSVVDALKKRGAGSFLSDFQIRIESQYDGPPAWQFSAYSIFTSRIEANSPGELLAKIAAYDPHEKTRARIAELQSESAKLQAELQAKLAELENAQRGE